MMARLLLTNVEPRAAFSSPHKIGEQVMIKKLMGCPGWLKLSEDRTSFIFDPEKAEIVRKIFEASISGLGGYTIAKQLDAKKVPAFVPSPKWDQSTIHNILRNRATIGEHQPKRIRNGKRIPEGDPISNFYPAVIEESLFLAAQIARQKNLASGRGRKGRLITCFLKLCSTYANDNFANAWRGGPLSALVRETDRELSAQF